MVGEMSFLCINSSCLDKTKMKCPGIFLAVQLTGGGESTYSIPLITSFKKTLRWITTPLCKCGGNFQSSNWCVFCACVCVCVRVCTINCAWGSIVTMRFFFFYLIQLPLLTGLMEIKMRKLYHMTVLCHQRAKIRRMPLCTCILTSSVLTESTLLTNSDTHWTKVFFFLILPNASLNPPQMWLTLIFFY